MTNTPPNLSYLTIYNPTLRPTGPIPDDDDDAEEQAQILFYTSKERAVSRDRMLRQVGLAKALVSFSEMFNTEDTCENVHSQTRRMIMVSPEPNFWIHAGVEVGKTPRTSLSSTKSKVKGKEKEKMKGKEKDQSGVVYDYSDASVHDVALRADIMRGYEKFKLTHGSFTTILSTLGQQALELQLERFFTVWAWSWNLEDGTEFGDHLGRIPLHPEHHSKAPILDELSLEIPSSLIPIALTPTRVIPSARFDELDIPPSLLPYLATLIHPPPKSEPVEESSSVEREGSSREESTDPSGKNPSDVGEGLSLLPGHGSLMGLNLNMNVNMDVRKWSWPGYLTFGKNSKKGSSSSTPFPEKTTPPESESDPGTGDQEQDKDKGNGDGKSEEEASESVSVYDSSQQLDGTVDQDALDDAMSSITPRSEIAQSPIAEPSEQDIKPSNRSFTTSELDKDSSSRFSTLDAVNTAELDRPSNPPTASASPLPSPLPPPELSVATIHLSESPGSTQTRRKRVLYMTEFPFMFALICLDDEEDFDLSDLAVKVSGVLRKLGIPSNGSVASSSSDTIATATKILQPNDRHIISLPHYTVPSSDRFSSKSTHLFNAQQLLGNSRLDIQEVFTKGMSPQHWHVGRKMDMVGNNSNEVNGSRSGEVFMEVFRKEASLTDVDNGLTGVVRRLNA
ncbi:hypothetical protein K435DRAFT_773740 [Dendrothele bispora CBS 962.96]|uniref:CCZ1/INTU/HSP4 first Longin domain-containing protein n=1 Tax=Dendrothele bispora (strain CBS 962.96) TaxID=1314807 RepID=A0A4S8MT70_DENBC|nr:hypothetical protein K435DRAFT_773740 [Dendrothele bispora CBS 962.96]